MGSIGSKFDHEFRIKFIANIFMNNEFYIKMFICWFYAQIHVYVWKS